MFELLVCDMALTMMFLLLVVSDVCCLVLLGVIKFGLMGWFVY